MQLKRNFSIKNLTVVKISLFSQCINMSAVATVPFVKLKLNVILGLKFVSIYVFFLLLEM